MTSKLKSQQSSCLARLSTGWRVTLERRRLTEHTCHLWTYMLWGQAGQREQDAGRGVQMTGVKTPRTANRKYNLLSIWFAILPRGGWGNSHPPTPQGVYRSGKQLTFDPSPVSEPFDVSSFRTNDFMEIELSPFSGVSGGSCKAFRMNSNLFWHFSQDNSIKHRHTYYNVCAWTDFLAAWG